MLMLLSNTGEILLLH